MKLLKEINEAAKAMRAWEGKLKRIDNYLQHLYDFMSQQDKNLKDSVFNTYYRHYNDGDFKSMPYSRLSKIGMSDDDINNIKQSRSGRFEKTYQEGIEAAVNVTIKYLLNKYKSKIKRSVTLYKDLIASVSNLKSDGYKSKYWLKDVAKKIKSPELEKYANELKELNKDVRLTKDLKPLSADKMKKIKEIIKSAIADRAGMLELDDLTKIMQGK